MGMYAQVHPHPVSFRGSTTSDTLLTPSCHARSRTASHSPAQLRMPENACVFQCVPLSRSLVVPLSRWRASQSFSAILSRAWQLGREAKKEWRSSVFTDSSPPRLVRLMRILENDGQIWCVHENYSRCEPIVSCLHYKDRNFNRLYQIISPQNGENMRF